MQDDKTLTRKIVVVFIIIVGVVVLLSVFRQVSHSGKTQVNIYVAPSDSTIQIDGEEISSGTIYLEPGVYSFVASSPGYSKDAQDISVESEPISVYLLPLPSSKNTDIYLSNNPVEKKAREDIASQKANQYGSDVVAKNPITELLPYDDPTGPFAIDYGPSLSGDNSVFLVISDSSPSGRAKAIKWIRQQGYDPSDYKIEYDDYISPLLVDNPEIIR